MKEKIINGIKGFIIGDALGVPYEFRERDQFVCSDMVGYGTYNQPPGTWSDDTSMMLATIEAFNHFSGVNPARLAMLNFKSWLDSGAFTPYGEVFDVGNTTRKAIRRFYQTSDEKTCGCSDERDNGNGALMRMLPLAFLPLPITEKLKVAREFAELTHSHELNLLACEFFVEVVDNLLNGNKDWLLSAYSLITFKGDENGIFARIPHVGRLSRKDIKSTGYVIDTLEAVLWCFITTDNYRDCVLQAVNLGGDTDTIAAIVGGLAGIKYGIQGEAAEWWKKIARREWIEKMCSNYLETLNYR